MFSFLDKEEIMVLRFSSLELETFNKNYGTGPNMQYGKVMREYVVIPDNLLEDTDALFIYLQRSFDYAKTLKPKPTEKK